MKRFAEEKIHSDAVSIMVPFSTTGKPWLRGQSVEETRVVTASWDGKMKLFRINPESKILMKAERFSLSTYASIESCQVFAGKIAYGTNLNCGIRICDIEKKTQESVLGTGAVWDLSYNFLQPNSLLSKSSAVNLWDLRSKKFVASFPGHGSAQGLKK